MRKKFVTDRQTDGKTHEGKTAYLSLFRSGATIIGNVLINELNQHIIVVLPVSTGTCNQIKRFKQEAIKIDNPIHSISFRISIL